MKTIAISGSHGFIGSNLMRSLEAEGHVVKRIWRDNLYTIDYLKKYLLENKVTDIIHCAAAGNSAHGFTHPSLILEANFTLLHNLLLASKDVPLQSFINFSTSAIQLPTQTLYSVTKAMGEKLSTFYATTYQQPIVSVRPFSVTGIGEQESHLIPTLIRAAYSGQSMPFVPDPVHDFIDIADLTRAISHIITNAALLGGSAIDIGTGLATPNLAVKDIVEHVTKRNIVTEEIATMRSYDTQNWQADTQRLSTLGFQPEKLLIDSITEMVAAYPI